MKNRIYFIWFLLLPLFLQAQTSSTTDEVKRLIARAKTAYSMGEYQDALTEYQKVQKLTPNYPELYKAVGDVYEKLGGDNDLKSAIESYNQYLKLSPQATDKEAIQEKIASLEYKFEKQFQQTQIMDDLSGIWVSDWVTEENTSKQFSEVFKHSREEYVRLTEYKDVPYIILEIKEIQKTGKYRVTLHPNCRMYQESIVEKTVNIKPEKNNSFLFRYSDSKVYNPSAAKYSGLRTALSVIGGSDMLQSVGNVAVDFAQEKDLPSNTQTAYDFELKYNNGKLEGLLNIIGKHTIESTAGNTQTNQDQLYEISFTKNNDYFNFENNPLMELGKGSVLGEGSLLYIKNNIGHRRVIANYNKDLLNKPQFKDIKAGYNMQQTGIVMFGIGLGAGLGAQFFRIKFTTTDSNSSEEEKRKRKERNELGSTIANYGAIVGGGVAVIGFSLLIKGNKKMGKAIEEYNNTIRQKNNQSYNLNFGITSSGGMGLVLNF